MMFDQKGIPLCVDLDGTLINTDTLHESFIILLKKNPFYIFFCILWLIKGKANLKHQISKRVDLLPDHLPYNKDVLDFIKKRKDSGAEIWLCTAASKKIALSISDHLGIFDKVLFSDEKTNLSSSRKASEIIKHSKSIEFDYIGNSKDDILVWDKCRYAYAANTKESVIKKVNKDIELHFSDSTNKLKTWIKQLRVHQWAKNLLVFIPLLASHNFLSTELVINSMLAFFAFGLCASSVYLLNDLVDLESDRKHKTKKNRPLASGAIPIAQGAIAAVLLLLSSIVISLLLPVYFMLSLLVYYVITVAYSFKMKSLPIIDITTLSILYSMRIVAGSAATGIILSNWLLSFSMFIFFSLATVKRVVELKSSKSNSILSGRGYSPDDMLLLISSGIASGYISILVFVLYIDSTPAVAGYNYSSLLYFISPILFVWLTRVWLLTCRGEMHDDPVAFAIKDRVSQLMGVSIIIIAAIATGISL